MIPCVFLIVDCPFFSRYIKISSSYTITITSPNYPLDYGKDSKCRWILNTESPGYLVKVTFNDFELQVDEPASINRCPYDSLEFHDGRDPYTPNLSLLGKYCDNLHPEVLYSTGEEMYVEFQSDSSRTYRGFNISILAVEAGMKMGGLYHLYIYNTLAIFCFC